jgi:hypothetical protein
MYRASLYIAVWNKKITNIGVDIFNEDDDKVWEVSTKLVTNRKEVDKFFVEQVNHYRWEHKVEFKPEYSLLYSTVESSDDNKLELDD